MTKKHLHITPGSLAVLLALPAVLYIHYRAAVLAFTYDECWTFMGYASEPFWDVVTNRYPAANNHILHSLMVKLAYSLGGNNEYVLRLPALLSFIPFAAAAFALLRSMHSGWWWAGYILLLYQPYLLDYFAIARGYAPAMAFMLVALYFTHRYAQLLRIRHLALSLLFGIMAAYSNFTYILPMISLWLASVFIGWKHGLMKRSLWMVGLAVLVSLALMAQAVIRLKDAGELFYGGREGFYADTLLTLANSFLYKQGLAQWLAWVFGIVMLFAAVLLLVKWVRGAQGSALFWTSWVLVSSVTGSILMHFLLDSPYLIDRTAMFIIPLLLLFVYGLLFNLRPGKWMAVPAVSLVLLATANMASAFNLEYQLDFREHADTRDAVKLIGDMVSPDDSFRLGKSTYMNATLMYYRNKYGIHQIKPAGLEFCDEAGETPFYYLFAKDVSCVEGKAVELIRYFPVSDTYLYGEKSKGS